MRKSLRITHYALLSLQQIGYLSTCLVQACFGILVAPEYALYGAVQGGGDFVVVRPVVVNRAVGQSIKQHSVVRVILEVGVVFERHTRVVLKSRQREARPHDLSLVVGARKEDHERRSGLGKLGLGGGCVGVGEEQIALFTTWPNRQWHSRILDVET